jgi:hypothetical protein
LAFPREGSIKTLPWIEKGNQEHFKGIFEGFFRQVEKALEG